jgi:hypothetical protein
LQAEGGTNISTAMREAKKLYTGVGKEDNSSSRIFFLTDMEIDRKDSEDFIDMIQKNSDNNLWATVIGVGLDLTQKVIHTVSCTRGCNYCNVRTTDNFKELMGEEFGFIVTPIAFNITISLKSPRYVLEKGYGSPEISNIQPGGLVKLSTEFPSSKNANGESRSGVFLFKIKDSSPAIAAEAFQLSITWDDINGLKQGETKDIQLQDGYQSLAIRKAILLVHYTDFLKDYLTLRKAESNAVAIAQFQQMRKDYSNFVAHFRSEMAAIGDETLKLELTNLIETAKLDDIPVDSDFNNMSNTTTTESATSNENNNSSSSSSSSSRSLSVNDINNNNNSGVVAAASNEIGQTIKDSTIPIAPEKQAKAEDDRMCCVCLAVPKSVLLQPCRHLCVCKNCSSKVVECPLCREMVVDKIEAFI